MGLRRAGQPYPTGIGDAAVQRGEAGVEHDELEAADGEHLGRRGCLFHRLRPHPEEPAQVDAGRFAELRVEVIADVDERGRFADGRRCGEGSQDDGEAQTAACHLRHLAAGQTAAEECVEGGKGGGEGLIAAPALQRADELRAAGESGHDRAFQAGPKLLDGLRRDRLYGRWIRDENWFRPVYLTIEELVLNGSKRSQSRHGGRRDNVGGNGA